MTEQASDTATSGPGLSGWGRTFRPGVELRAEGLERLTVDKPLSRGMGRSYGDASLLAHGDRFAAGTTLADLILSLDETTGILHVEAGLCLSELNRVLMPRLWFTPVTPGTKFVTLGGMVASDVHGKNHHVAGTFGSHVTRLKLRTGRGRVVECSPTEHEDLFYATIGGMGLTGHILEVWVRMKRIPSTWMVGESYRVDSLHDLLGLLDEKGKEWPYTATWCDTVTAGRGRGRGILFLGRWAEPDEAKAGLSKPPPAIPMPLTLPSGLLNRFTVRVFNELVFRSHVSRVKKGIITPDACFYPLDKVHNWNRGYGKAGVTQHQSVVDKATGAQALLTMMDVLEQNGACSFLTVVKDCAAEGRGMLSFPKPGISLALDLPIRENTRHVVAKLNEVVLQHNGRIYLTKDGMTDASTFRRMDPRVDAFLAVKNKWDPDGEFRSAQSARLFNIGTL